MNLQYLIFYCPQIKQIQIYKYIIKTKKMGTTHPTPQPTHLINHQKFKQSNYIKELDILRTTITTENESQYDEWVSKLNKTASIDDQVILLPKAYQVIKKALCGSSCTIQIDFDHYPYILADQLKNRRTVGRYFDEKELWYLLYSLVTAAHDFEKLGDRIGDVRPENIFINQDGHIKVSNLYSWPGQMTNYSKTIYDHQRTYLSPEQCQSARQGQNNTYLDKYKSQSFSIGLTLLETALIKNLSYLYLNNNSFDYGELNRVMKQWEEHVFRVVDQEDKGKGEIGNDGMRRYSDVFKAVIMAMCQVKPQDRLLAEDVYKWLKGHHKQINQIKPFYPGPAPLPKTEKYARFNKVVTNQYVSNQLGSFQSPVPNQGLGYPDTEDNYRKVFDRVAKGNMEENRVVVPNVPNYSNQYNTMNVQGQGINKFGGNNGVQTNQFQSRQPMSTMLGGGFILTAPNQPISSNQVQIRQPPPNIYTSQIPTSTSNYTVQQFQTTTTQQYASTNNPNIRPFIPIQPQSNTIPSQNLAYQPYQQKTPLSFTSATTNQNTIKYPQPSTNLLPTTTTTSTSYTTAPLNTNSFNMNLGKNVNKVQPISSSEARSLDFLRQIDEKLDKLKQDSI